MKPRRIHRIPTPLTGRTRDLLAAGHKAWRTAKNQALAIQSIQSGNYKLPWSTDEDQAVLRLDVPVAVIARTIGRSFYACQVRRWKLRKRMK